MAIHVHDFIEVDASEVKELVNKAKWIYGVDETSKRLKWAIQDTARRARTITSGEVPNDYNAKKKDVRQVFGRNKFSGGGVNITCTIPLTGSKWTIGGNHVPAKGGVPGWEAVKYAGRGYKITAQILKNESSTLPHTMKNYGGQPPFINTAAPKLHGAVFTREGKSRFPIRPVAALGVPQMPPNRSKDNIEDQIGEELLKQVEKRFKDLL